jgi:hypothetical protein
MNIQSRALRLAVLLAAGLSVVAANPRPTPTPEPRLTGGFGKAPAAEPSARRAAEKKKLRITNESLVTEPDKGRVSTSEVVPPPTPTPRSPRTRVTPAASASEEAAEPREGGEGYWREEARRARERVATIREEIARLEIQVKKLESDFYSWDDGAYRDRVIKPAWDKAREDLATARKDLPEAEKDLADLPERARRAGAQPGWLRE